ncbi:hypothetical protein ACFLQ6_03785 [Thermoproteota archaeon]
MNIKRLQQKLKQKHEEAESLRQKLDQSINLIKDTNQKIINEYLRSKLIQEINQKSNFLLEIAYQKQIELPILLKKDDKIIIVAVRIKNETKNNFFFDTILKSNIDPLKSDRNIQRNLTIEEFKNQTNQLTRSILNGEKDSLLGLDVDEMLWNIM